MERNLKREAAEAALVLVESGMRLGIGSGSTAEEFVKVLGAKVSQGLDIIGVPTSVRTEKLCLELSIPLTTLDETPQLDLTIDGADELDDNLQLIKGGGGALLREKIVAKASNAMAVIADENKLVSKLGRYPLPVEVNPFGLRATKLAIEQVCGARAGGGNYKVRGGTNDPFVTDGGHYIIDIDNGLIDDAKGLSDDLLEIPGVVQHGLFLSLATQCFIAGDRGMTHLEA